MLRRLIADEALRGWFGWQLGHGSPATRRSAHRNPFRRRRLVSRLVPSKNGGDECHQHKRRSAKYQIFDHCLCLSAPMILLLFGRALLRTRPVAHLLWHSRLWWLALACWCSQGQMARSRLMVLSLCVGSLRVNGSLACRGSLDLNGALSRRGSLLGIGTLGDHGSLFDLGALLSIGSLALHGASRRCVARSTRMVLSDWLARSRYLVLNRAHWLALTQLALSVFVARSRSMVLSDEMADAHGCWCSRLVWLKALGSLGTLKPNGSLVRLGSLYRSGSLF